MQNSEIQKFASWFHQDFGVMFKSIEQGAETYLDTLPIERKKILIDELSQLLKSYPGEKGKGLRNAWLRLGAQWWDTVNSPKMLKKLVAKQ